MKLFATFLLLVCSGWAVTVPNTLTIYDVDNVAQTNRPTTFGRVFKQGEIPHFAQPLANGTALTGSNWQCDVKNRFPDGSLKFAVISLIATVPQLGNVIISFQDSLTGNNTGFLTQSGMLNFNGGAWGAEITVTANGITVTRDAHGVSGMLSQSDPGTNAQIGSTAWPDGKNDYWLQGPVVTAVMVQDSTNAFTNDFGWQWNGTTMSGPSGAGSVYTTTSQFASLHPAFILYFYPSITAVQSRFILENDWSFRQQDQMYDYAFKTGSPLATVYGFTGARVMNGVSGTNQSGVITGGSGFTSADVGNNIQTQFWASTVCSIVSSTSARLCSRVASFSPTNARFYVGLHSAMTRTTKTFWSGTAPAHVRYDHNFAYLTASQAIPSYDSNLRVSSNRNGDGTEGYGNFVQSDMGDPGGEFYFYTWSSPDFSVNNEGAALQREDLLYLYNSNPLTSFDGKGCGDANSHCAMAWQILTGEKGSIDTNLANGPQQPTTLVTPQTGNGYALTGGAGVWSHTSNFVDHLRESRTAATGAQPGTSNFLYCPGFADINAAVNTTTCGAGAGSATGQPVSRHAHADGSISASTIQPVPVGTILVPGNATTLDSGHWLDYSYLAYLLTGDYYYAEEDHFGASWNTLVGNNPQNGFTASRFGILQARAVPAGPRYLGWPLTTIGKAAFVSPDNSPQKLYFTSVLNKNLQVLEGEMGITGSPLQPSTIHANCSPYDSTSANAWDYGRCTVFSGCFGAGACAPIVNSLSDVVPGACRNGGSYGTITSASTGTTTVLSYTLDVGLSPRPASLPLAGSIDISGATSTWATGTTSGGNVYLPAGGPCTTGINCGWNILSSTGSTVTIGYNSTGKPALTGTVIFNAGFPGGGLTYADPRLSADYSQPWQYTSSIEVGLGMVQEMGVAASTAAMTRAQERAIQQILEVGSFPPIAAMFVLPNKFGNAACNNSMDLNPMYANWAAVAAAVPLPIVQYGSYLSTNGVGSFPCDGHGYGVEQRGGLSFSLGNSVNVADLLCSGGTCLAQDAWNYAAVNGYTGGNGGAIPFFNNAAAIAVGGGGCAVGDQVKFATVPRVGVSIPLSVNGVSLPGATTGTPYSVTFTGNGGTAPYTWSLAAGSVPGMTLSSAGLFSGTPTTPGTFAFTVQVNDAASGTATRPFAITVTGPPTPLTITTGILPPGTIGASYSVTFTATGGTLPYTWSMPTGAVPGLSFTSGVLSGVLSTVGTFPFTIRVGDAAAGSDTRPFSITVNPFVPPVGNGGVVIGGQVTVGGQTQRQ